MKKKTDRVLAFEIQNKTLETFLKELKKHIKKMPKLFNLDDLYNMFTTGKVNAYKMSILRTLYECGKNGTLSCVGDLIFDCGEFDMAFPAGESPFTKEQTVWLNEFGEIGFKIKHELNNYKL